MHSQVESKPGASKEMHSQVESKPGASKED